MFGLKLRGEANLSVVTLKPSLNACMYLSGVVHWFASLLFFHHLLCWCLCLVSVQWLLESPSDHIVCVCQADATVSV